MNIILFDALQELNFIPSMDYRSQHITAVLRLGVGGTFAAGIINGEAGEATILARSDEGITFSFKATDSERWRLYPVTLLVAQVRPISMRRILREAVSLGVGQLVLVSCDTSERSYAQAKLYESGQYRSILIDGAMQSASTGVPPLLFASSVDEALELCDPSSIPIVLDNKRAGSALSQMVLDEKAAVTLAIGGERGFSDRERALFDQAGFRFATLGERVLRTETAVSAGLAVLLGRMGLL